MSLINQYRVENGLPAFVQNDICQNMASWKVSNMATYGYSIDDSNYQTTQEVFQNKYSITDWDSVISYQQDSYFGYDSDYYPNNNPYYSNTEQIAELAQNEFNSFCANSSIKAMLLNNEYVLGGLSVSIGTNGEIYYAFETANSVGYTSSN